MQMVVPLQINCLDLMWKMLKFLLVLQEHSISAKIPLTLTKFVSLVLPGSVKRLSTTYSLNLNQKILAVTPAEFMTK